MPSSIQKLFAKSPQKNDGLKQSQREALVDLLHFCMFVDNLVALKEDQFINTVANTLSWDANISFEVYEGMSIGKARRAKESASYQDEFLKEIGARLESQQMRELGFDLVKKLFAADAGMSEKESQILPKVRTSLGLK